MCMSSWSLRGAQRRQSATTSVSPRQHSLWAPFNTHISTHAMALTKTHVAHVMMSLCHASHPRASPFMLLCTAASRHHTAVHPPVVGAPLGTHAIAAHTTIVTSLGTFAEVHTMPPNALLLLQAPTLLVVSWLLHPTQCPPTILLAHMYTAANSAHISKCSLSLSLPTPEPSCAHQVFHARPPNAHPSMPSVIPVLLVTLPTAASMAHATTHMPSSKHPTLHHCLSHCSTRNAHGSP
jgi:hypothetical protein